MYGCHCFLIPKNYHFITLSDDGAGCWLYQSSSVSKLYTISKNYKMTSLMKWPTNDSLLKITKFTPLLVTLKKTDTSELIKQIDIATLL